MAFVHLHNHTEYSLLDGATHVKDMVERAAELGMPAIAVTDHGVMSGMVELCDACDAVEKKTGVRVKPIYGCEVYFTDGVDDDDNIIRESSTKRYHMILLAKNDEGYHNLLKLVSKSHIDNFYYKPLTTFKMLQQYGHGLIATTACMQGIVPCLLDAGQEDLAFKWAQKLASCFDPGDFYIEVQNHNLRTRNGEGITDLELDALLARIAERGGWKLVATNDFHYLLRENARAQDIMMCIGMGKTFNDANRMKMCEELYMKTEEEMRECMGPDFQEACDNTIEIAEKCNVTLERDSILPRFPLPEGETEESYFRKQVNEGLKRRYGDPVPAQYQERADYEMGIIIQQGFAAYFLIVQEYITWARDNGIGVGPGRGSAAGAIVTYAMGITDLDPISNGLMFERFLSPERVEMPDIDVDFDDERRGEVIEHIKEFYGEDHVSQVITFGRLKAKNAVRDAARVLDYPYAVGDRIAKMIGDDIGITLEGALKQNPDLKKAYESEEDVKAIMDAAMSIEGNIRGEGVHACATIICRDPMSDHVPMKRDTKGGGIITQYDGHYTPELGLLKMDFLGLRTLGVLSRACNNIERRFGKKIVPEEIPTEDPKAFELICSGNTDGLFQVESALYVSLFKRIPPKTFAEIVASIALNRPGPLESGMVDDYVDVVSGRKQPNYYDDRLKPVLEETYGTIVYQEQLMQISMVMSGFSAGKSDRLRKAMGKKQLAIMQELKVDWSEGAVANGYKLETATEIWDAAEKFAAYAFNKSHSAAYAILVMRTAYLKAYYPNDYMAAVLSSYMGNTDRLIKYIASCNHNGIPVLPPDINASNAEFTPVDEGIRFGLVGVRGVGANVADAIIAEREANGPYTSLHDFVNRLDAKCYNRKTLEALIKGGAFDSTGYTRKQLMYFVDETPLLEGASKRQKDRDAGQVSMFDMFADDEDSGFSQEVPPPDGVEWPKRQMLAFEKEIMKIYVSDHPLRPYEAALSRMTKYQLGDLAERTKGIDNATFVGMVSNVSVRLTKRGTKMATFTLEDTTGHCECICFKFDDYAECIVEDAIVRIKGKFEKNDRGDQISAFEVQAIELDEKDAGPRNMEIYLRSSDLSADKSSELNRILRRYPGHDIPVIIAAQSDGRRFRAQLPLQVDSDNRLMKSELVELFGRNVLVGA